MLGLSFAGGCVDAGTYLGLGHVFPANMTGNTVLLGIAIAQATGTEAARAAVALGAFCVGVALGTALLRSDPRWPWVARLSLTFESVALAALLGFWSGLGLAVRFALIALAAAAMGTQSTAVRASQVGGVTTTYVTGTLTTTVARTVKRLLRRPEPGNPSPVLPGESWAAYALGGLVGALAETAWHAGVMAIPLAIVLASTAGAWARRTGKEP